MILFPGKPILADICITLLCSAVAKGVLEEGAAAQCAEECSYCKGRRTGHETDGQAGSPAYAFLNKLADIGAASKGVCISADCDVGCLRHSVLRYHEAGACQHDGGGAPVATGPASSHLQTAGPLWVAQVRHHSPAWR